MLKNLDEKGRNIPEKEKSEYVSQRIALVPQTEHLARTSEPFLP